MSSGCSIWIVAGFCAAINLLSAAIVPPVIACSICRCGDPTFNALGSDIYWNDAFHFALDWDRYSKEQGMVEEEGLASVTENRLTATLSYSFDERFNLIARIPASFKSLREGDELIESQGFSDPELLALVRVWASALEPGYGRRTWISAQAGVKTPWGNDELSRDGERLDEHSQPGTGSTDLFTGLSFFRLMDDRSSMFASLQYRGTGANEFGYAYGDIALANLAYERKLFAMLDTVVELNYRYAATDEIDASGTTDPNTGGSVLYVTPRVLVPVAQGLVARVAVQVPAWKDLNGVQEEKAVVNSGVTYLF
jgi:hypothetical protein